MRRELFAPFVGKKFVGGLECILAENGLCNSEQAKEQERVVSVHPEKVLYKAERKGANIRDFLEKMRFVVRNSITHQLAG